MPLKQQTQHCFDGCILTLVPGAQVEAVRKIVAVEYEICTGIKKTFYVCQATQGASKC